MIRPATMTDLPWLRRLYADFCQEFRAPYPTTDEEELDRFVLTAAQAFRAADPALCCLVAEEEEGMLMGFLGVGIMLRAVGKPQAVATPYWLYVVPAHRGHGIGRQLAAAGLAWLREKWPTIATIEIPARAGDPQWTRWGFVPFLVYHQGPLSLVDTFITGEKAPPSPVVEKKEKRRGRPKRTNGPAREVTVHE